MASVSKHACELYICGLPITESSPHPHPTLTYPDALRATVHLKVVILLLLLLLLLLAHCLLLCVGVFGLGFMVKFCVCFRVRKSSWGLPVGFLLLRYSV